MPGGPAREAQPDIEQRAETGDSGGRVPGDLHRLGDPALFLLILQNRPQKCINQQKRVRHGGYQHHEQMQHGR